MVKFIGAILFISNLIACNNSSESDAKKPTQSTNSYISLNESIKKQIYERCQAYDSTFSIYSIDITKLYYDIIIHPLPVFYYEYLKEKGIPSLFYEYLGKLFLLYTGIEKFTLTEPNNSELLRKKYDSICRKFNIGKIDFIYDNEPLFLKFKNDSLFVFKDYKFEALFYGRETFSFDKKNDSSMSGR